MNINKVNWQWNGSLSKRARTDYIALHHAEASKATVQDIDRWHKDNGWCGIGYHFYVRKDGTIYEGRPLWALGAHVSGMNNCSIGICAEGAYGRETMPAVQKKAICELIVYLKDNFYPNAKIVGHREIGDSNCPGNNYPLADIKANYRFYAGNNTQVVEEEDIDMTKYEELVNKINALTGTVQSLQNEVNSLTSEFIYNYIDKNMPDWARPVIAALVEVKVIAGVDDNGCLGLKYSDLRFYVINYRAGAYDTVLKVKRDDNGTIISSPIVEKYDK